MALTIEWFSDSETARAEAKSLLEDDPDKLFKDLGSSQLKDSDSVGAVLKLNDEPIGFFVVNTGQVFFEIYKLFIKEDSRGKGYGAEAVDYLINLGRDEGFQEMGIEVAGSASSFWERYLSNRELCWFPFPGKFQIHLDHDENDLDACPHVDLK
ncbi:GNAT family N-acetyltransferase [Alcaligenes sp. MMA]|uniref:GNAT family N-acetyltransferase n=1 Tax=Alcaligenes sp. MMA TaxID=2893019 RepID=UPI001E513D7D|nr:GNAT family N-acetyltransferase [Alcaligenes sp. MMA]MCC9162839.1 GNAT family N-acetyltransferase [Alcaligenes sp. MMA]